ncbi:MAG TPA: YbjN domain-containing protein [Chloroflexia bacterium]|jgi:hypothetical protein
MGAIFDVMTTFFKEDGWTFSQIEGTLVLSIQFLGDNARFICHASEETEKQIFLFYSYAPVKAPEDKRPILADFLTRANYGLYIGNFEMDYNDGEIRYKTSIDVENAELNSPLIKGVVYPNVSVMDKYLPGIMAVIYGGSSPTEAIALVEG